MTDRQLIAFALMILLAVGLAAAIWWGQYHSHRRIYLRQQEERRKTSAARALALMSAPNGGDPG